MSTEITSDLPVADEQENEAAERPFLVRTFDAKVTAGDGRTVDVRIVPYGETALSNDGKGGYPKGMTYQETWVARAFDDQIHAANEAGRAREIWLNFEHQPGLQGVIGHGLLLREASDALYGSFRLHETADGDKALTLVREGVLGGVSMEALPKKTVRTSTGMVQRVKGHLFGVALCRRGAYPSAAVLALREHSETVFDEEMLPVEIDPELLARCKRLGIALPASMTAHPAETSTPAESGTLADGTRQEAT